MAVRPHVSFTLYDEAALGLRPYHWALVRAGSYPGNSSFTALLRCSGLYLFATAAGLSPLLAGCSQRCISLGAAVIGPAVLIVEYEPVPRGFALPFRDLLAGDGCRKPLVRSQRSSATRGLRLSSAHGTRVLRRAPGFDFAAEQGHSRALAVAGDRPAVLVISVHAAGAAPESAPLFATT